MTGEVQCTIKIPNRLLLKWANVKDKNYIALANTSIKELLNEKSESLDNLLGLTVITAKENAKVMGRKRETFLGKCSRVFILKGEILPHPKTQLRAKELEVLRQ